MTENTKSPAVRTLNASEIDSVAGGFNKAVIEWIKKERAFWDAFVDRVMKGL